MVFARGKWQLSVTGTVSALQWFDPVRLEWVNLLGPGAAWATEYFSDGSNFRVVNLSDSWYTGIVTRGRQRLRAKFDDRHGRHWQLDLAADRRRGLGDIHDQQRNRFLRRYWLDQAAYRCYRRNRRRPASPPPRHALFHRGGGNGDDPNCRRRVHDGTAVYLFPDQTDPAFISGTAVLWSPNPGLVTVVTTGAGTLTGLLLVNAGQLLTTAPTLTVNGVGTAPP